MIIKIPIIRLELSEQNPPQFAQQLGQTLENLGVAQVDGLEQHLMDELYQASEVIFKKYEGRPDSSFYRHQKIKDAESHQKQTLFLSTAEMSYQDYESVALVSKVSENLITIYEKVGEGLKSYQDIPSLATAWTNLILVKYYSDRQKIDGNVELSEDHCDGRNLTIAPKATSPGLEGFIGEQWVPLEPETGHVLVFLGERRWKTKIRPLRHRVRTLFPIDKPRKAIVFGF